MKSFFSVLDREMFEITTSIWSDCQRRYGSYSAVMKIAISFLFYLGRGDISGGVRFFFSFAVDQLASFERVRVRRELKNSGTV